MVLREVKDQPTTVATRTTEFVGNGDEHEELKEPYRRSILARQRRLTGVEEERRSPPLSGPGQGDAAAGSMKIRGATAAAAEARAEERQREEEEGECEKRVPGRPIYKASHKWARYSRRLRRGYLPLTAPRFSERQ